MNSTSNCTEQSDLIAKDKVIFPQIISLIVLFGISIVTIIGNILVITAIIKTPKLRIRSNYLILSLCVTDLSIGLILMPIGAIFHIIHLGYWKWGAVFCDVLILLAGLVTRSSTFHMVFIAIDRYLSVTRIEYSMSKKKRYVVAMICISWITSLIIALTPILGWRNYEDYLARIEKGLCFTSLSKSRQIFISVVSFFLPVTIMVILYIEIYRVTI